MPSLRSILFGLCWANLWCFARLFAQFCRLALWRKANRIQDKKSKKKRSLHCRLCKSDLPMPAARLFSVQSLKGHNSTAQSIPKCPSEDMNVEDWGRANLEVFQETQTYDMTSCFTNVSKLRVFKVGWGGQEMITFLALAIRTVRSRARKFGSKSGLRSKNPWELLLQMLDPWPCRLAMCIMDASPNRWHPQKLHQRGPTVALCLTTVQSAEKKTGEVKKRFV